MGKKYFIELLDDCPSEFKGIIVFGLTPEGQIATEPIPVEDLTPYTAPDIEQVRKEAYDTAYADAEEIYESGKRAMYQKGLKDAWEAARKICLEEDDGGIPASAINDIFNVCNYRYAVKDYSASECIEKIRQYEEKEEIRVGDEVEDGVANLIVLEINEDGTVSGFDDEGSIIHATPRKKTGRHFSEIAEVLRKMKE